MKRGVILELCEGSAVVLDTGGSFYRVSAQPDWKVGDVVPLTRRVRPRTLLALAACLALVILSGGGAAGLWFTQTGLVSLDVNPSIELHVNRFDRVISAQALNQEGQVLLSQTEVQGLDCGTAVSALLTQGQSYLIQDPSVTLTVQAGTQKQEVSLLALADAGASGSTTSASVECHRVDQALVEQAHSHGVTAGKYLALLDLQAADPLLDIEGYTHCGIGEIKAETQRCLDRGHDSIPDTTDTTDTPLPPVPTDHGNGYGEQGYGHHGMHH